MNKAKSLLLAEARKLRSKAAQKQREAERLLKEAAELEEKANEE